MNICVKSIGILFISAKGMYQKPKKKKEDNKENKKVNFFKKNSYF
jgi:hypothetical protein